MEIWKDIKNYEGLYQVSSNGAVKSLPRKVINKHGNVQTYPGKLLKPDVYVTPHSHYLRVTLSKQHRTLRQSVHRLVAEAFIPNPGNKPCVNHLDNDATNNTVGNLEWCTHSENMIHAQKQGRLFESQSRGGLIGGAVGAQRRAAKIAAIQNTYIGNWYVTNQSPIAKGQKLYMQCKCSCGAERAVELTRLIRAETTHCRACGQRQRRSR